MAEGSNFQERYNTIARFVVYLAGLNGNPEVIGMEFDDLVSELNLEIVKCDKAYQNLPTEQYKAVMRKVCDFRISELKYRYYKTHRRLGNVNMSLELDINLDIPGTQDTEEEEQSMYRVQRTRALLRTDLAKIIFDFLILGDDNSSTSNMLQSFSNRPKDVANYLGLEEKCVRKAYKEIQKCYEEVLNE